ncbi:hypothetical protein FLX56_23135 [Synechococcus moorigangaii CMS01]|nr:hypothetical protein [Synechococcus moorigangaii CMS01]
MMQWLAEIKSLKQQLAQTQQDLQACQTRELAWRQRYTEEAQQRRTEARLHTEQLTQVEANLRALQARFMPPPGPAEHVLRPDVEAIADPDILKHQLITAITEREQARQALYQEQQHHAQTRENLTMVINDLVEQIQILRQP